MPGNSYSEVFSIVNQDSLIGEPILLHYVPVSEAHAMLWQDNPKEHDYGAIILSIKNNGFADPPKWDATLNGLVSGNGRTTALNMMELSGDYNLPRGILLDDKERWCMPVIFGLDAASQAAAKRYAIDHNNLTMAGGEFTSFDMMRMWDRDKMEFLLGDMREDGIPPITFDIDDIDVILNGFDFEPLPDTTNENDNDATDTSEAYNYVTVTVMVQNYNLYSDVVSAIKSLLINNPEWDSYIADDDK